MVLNEYEIQEDQKNYRKIIELTELEKKQDLKLFHMNLDTAFQLLGSFKVEALLNEETSRLNARRSLVAAKDIPKGKIIEKSDLTFKRPAHGISPKYFDEVVGQVANTDIQEDDILVKELFQ